jgi:hypothetical protein
MLQSCRLRGILADLDPALAGFDYDYEAQVEPASPSDLMPPPVVVSSSVCGCDTETATVTPLAVPSGRSGSAP